MRVLLAASLLAGIALARDPDTVHVALTVEGTERLSPEFRALEETGGILLGRTEDGRTLIEMARNAFEGHGFEKFLVPRTEHAAEDYTRFVVLLRPGKTLDQTLLTGGLKKVGECRDGGFVVLESRRLSFDAVRPLLNDAIRLEPDHLMQVDLQEPPAATWETHFPKDHSFDLVWGMVSVRAPEAWSRIRRTGIVVAVIDTGVSYPHEDLVLWTNEKETDGNGRDDDDDGCYADDIHGWNFIENNADFTDKDGHGTHCAGIIGAQGDNEKGIAGVGWATQVMALRFMTRKGDRLEGRVSNACKAIYYAVKKGAKVINASWGSESRSEILERAVRHALENDVLLVAAAGNRVQVGRTTRTAPLYPAAYDLPNVISVIAIQRDDTLYGRSRFGTTGAHLGAPGRLIYSTWHEKDRMYGYNSGTSAAAPFVAGAAALTWWHPDYRDLTPEGMRDLLMKHARPSEGLIGKCSAEGTLDLSFLGRG